MNFLKSKIYYLIVLITCSLIVSGQGDSADDWRALFNAGIASKSSRDYDKAHKALEQAFEIAQRVFSDQGEELDLTAYHLGIVLKQLGHCESAIKKLEYSSKIHKANNSIYSKGYERRLVLLGTCYNTIGNFKISNEKYKEALAILHYNNNRLSKNYVNIQRRIVSNNLMLGDFEDSIALLNEGLSIIEQVRGAKDKEYVQNQFLLARVYFKQGSYDYSEQLLRDILKENEQRAHNDKMYYLGWHELSKSLIKQGKYKLAIDALLKSIAGLDSKSTEYAIVKTDLALTYENLGKDKQAIKMYKELINTMPSQDPNYLNVLQGLALVYTKLGDYFNAKVYYDEALLRLTDADKEDQKLNASKLINNVGKLYFKMKNFEKANAHYAEALDLFLNIHNKDHFDYGYLVADYAFSLYELGEHNTAIKLLIENIYLDEINGRLNTESYANKLLKLAIIYNRINEFDKAIPILINSLEILRHELGDNHLDYGNALVELSKAYASQNLIDKAISIIVEANTLFMNQLRYNFKFRTEHEKKLFTDKLLEIFDVFQSIGLQANNKFANINAINLNNQLVLKGLLLSNTRNILSELESLDSQNVTELLYNYRVHKHHLNEALLKVNRQSEESISVLKKKVNDLELKIVEAHSSNFSNEIIFDKQWTAARDQLHDDELAIEFSNVKYKNGEKDTKYVAYIYNKFSAEPIIVPLFDEPKLLAQLKTKSPNTLYTSRGSKGNSAGNSEALYDLIWKPLELNLQDFKKIFYSPAGLLYQVSFAALVNAEKKLLCNQYDLFQLNSTSIIQAKPKRIQFINPLLVGGINYNFILDKTTVKSNISENNNSNKWSYLKGTYNEIMAISQILNLKNYTHTMLTADNATELNFKTTVEKSPSIIHLATHGFFFENVIDATYTTQENEQNNYNRSKDPLMRTGLILTGANSVWGKNSTVNPNNDGILTALEISQLNLRNTNMVVLSACETGMGDISGSEGVYGLQRAFKMAGVDKIVMSLWDVPDKETSEFMILFYKIWLETGDSRIAFIETQRTMASNYKATPSKWAAFVMVE